MMEYKLKRMDLLRLFLIIIHVFAVHYSYAHPAFAYLHRLTKLLVTEGENEMKVVVVRSPKLFSGILRLIFGIKRQEQTT